MRYRLVGTIVICSWKDFWARDVSVVRLCRIAHLIHRLDGCRVISCMFSPSNTFSVQCSTSAISSCWKVVLGRNMVSDRNWTLSVGIHRQSVGNCAQGSTVAKARCWERKIGDMNFAPFSALAEFTIVGLIYSARNHLHCNQSF